MQRLRNLTILLVTLTLHWLPLALIAQGEFWQQTQGPPGGTITAIGVSNGGVILAGTVYSGVFRSTDNGESWVQSGLPGRWIYAIALSPSGDVFVSSGCIHRSGDNGQSWTPIGLTDVRVLCIAINDSGHIFAGTYGNGVYRSIDNGESWAAVNAFLYDHDVRTLAINDSGHIFAGTYHELFLSTDNGETWIPTGLGSYIPDPPIGVSSIAINDSGHVFAGCRAKGIYRSVSGGQSWELVGLADESIYAVVIAPNGHIFTGTWDGDVFHSIDNGETWTSVGAGLPPEQSIYCLAVNSSNHIFAVVGSLGLYRSVDLGASWAPVINGLVSTKVKLLAINATREIFASSAFNFFRSTDGGESWNQVASGAAQSICFSPNGYIFIGQSGIFRSGDNGDSWRQVYLHRASSLASNSEGHIFAATTNAIIRSTDNGATWTELSDDVDGKLVAVDSAGNIFIMGGGPEGSSHWKSFDNGENWTRLSLDAEVYSVGLDLHYLYAGSDGGDIYDIYRSGDGGETWTAFDIGQWQVKSLIINSEGTVFAGAYGGIFSSADYGETWTRRDSGLTHTANGTLALDPEGHLYAGTDGGGVYRSAHTTLSVREPQDKVPISFILEQNYPNPFNPTTGIRYILPVSQTVTLRVYDLLGREVATLVDGSLPAGEHKVTFDSGNLPSGIYLYQLAAGRYVQTRKMLLLK